MQFLYSTNEKPEVYLEGKGNYPDAPKRCPHKGCHMPVQLKKHGFYKRYIIILKGLEGYIRIRRYRCPVCGRTVSMLPAFCVPGFQYGAEVIVGITREACQHGNIRRTVREWEPHLRQITRRHLLYYLSRLQKNRRLLQLGINEISRALIRLGAITEDKKWTQSFLAEIRRLNPLQFNADFHRITGKSFMSLHNMVA